MIYPITVIHVSVDEGFWYQSMQGMRLWTSQVRQHRKYYFQ